MELPELCLGSAANCANSSSSESETNVCRKRKFWSENCCESVDLQFRDALPLDWEQCLDLESGRMYYLNRKTARKSWSWPKDHKLDLELNIASSNQLDKTINDNDNDNKYSLFNISKSSSSNMVALACLNCHLLVMLSKSSPSCPNCKYLHSLPFRRDPSPRKMPVTVKSLSTLSLLN